MDYTKATNKQLWAIIRGDMECPLPLMEGVFHEAVDRGMIKQFVIAVIKDRFGSLNIAQSILKMPYAELIQVGYEGAMIAIRDFKPGKSSFSRFLFLNISRIFGRLSNYMDAKKREREEFSLNQFISDGGDTFERYMVDWATNVEKTVITKITLEEKMELLSPVQRETFNHVFLGYQFEEIAEQMKTNKKTLISRVRTAFIKMTGQPINLRELGLAKRGSYKKQGA